MSVDTNNTELKKGADLATMAKKYRVTITEALKRTVDVTAECKEAAEQIVGDEWYSGKHILTADDFTGVEFEANTI